MKKEKTNKLIYEKILSIFAWLTFVLAILLAILTVFSSFSDEKNGKEIFGRKFLIVASDSMSKSSISSSNNDEQIFFNSGDVIIIKTAYDVKDLRVGDVISFFSYNPDSYGKTLTHKIRSIKYSPSGNLIGFETYGINTGVSDKALVQPESIMGVYSSKIGGVGNVFAYLKTPSGYYLSILTPSVLLIIFFSINVGKYFGRREALREYRYDNEEIEELRQRIILLEQKSQVTVSAIEPIEEELIEQSVPEQEMAFATSNKKISFIEKLMGLDCRLQGYFNTVHNELRSYKKVRSRLSFKCVSYRLGRKLLAKITVRGKTVKLHLALNVQEFNQNTYFQRDMSGVKAYEEVPFTVKVKSDRGEKNAVKLIQALMQANQVAKNDKYVQEDLISKSNNLVVGIQSDETPIESPIIDSVTKLSIAKKPFVEKLMNLEANMQGYFNTVHNELCSYKKMHSRLSIKCVSYRLGRKLLAKITVRGKTMKLHLALNLQEFNQNAYFQKDMSGVKAYEEVPFTVKVKSDRGKKKALKLIQALMQQNGVIKNEKYIPKNNLEILKNQ